jgi:selenocysteine-specific elongation factor
LILSGITLDLGFSSFVVDIPERLQSGDYAYSKLQFTLVDCPGHASLIRTIIGGAQIIDMMILVIDINKGIQTQTAECVVIGEITTDKMIIVLNKIDLIPPEQRETKIAKVKARLTKIFSTTKFANAMMFCISAAVGGD